MWIKEWSISVLFLSILFPNIASAWTDFLCYSSEKRFSWLTNLVVSCCINFYGFLMLTMRFVADASRSPSNVINSSEIVQPYPTQWSRTWTRALSHVRDFQSFTAKDCIQPRERRRVSWARTRPIWKWKLAQSNECLEIFAEEKKQTSNLRFYHVSNY